MACFSEPTCFYKQKLDCSSRNITFVNLNCENSRTIKVLNYSNNAISYIKEDTFENVTNLQHLYLNDNEISRIEEHTFRSLDNIRYLHLSNNNIQNIHRNSFKNLSNLVFIDLEDNKLSIINDGTFINCNSLWQVHLAKNKIQKIQENSFKENCNLKHLYCSHNEIKTLKFLKNLPRLVFLDLSFNKIQEIPTFAFLQTKDLKKLNLSYNKLEVLYSGTFNHLPVLIDLNLSHNKLKDLGEGPFDYLFALRDLDIRSNCVELFSYGANFGQLRSNTVLSIYIDDNDWRCNYIHRIKQLPGIKLVHFNTNESVSNIEGIPCKDKVLYFEKSTSTVITTPEISTIITTVNIANSTNATIFMEIINITTSTVISTEDTTSTSKQTTHSAVITESTDRDSADAVTLPDIQIDKSIIFVAAIIAVIIILAVVILSIRYYFKKCSTASGCERVNDDYLMQTFPPKKSNFYITLDAYNEYEEIPLNDSDSIKEHIYEKIE
ncbi:hypothetical protein ILUMI_21586 [Ignelater luminosus]|uniref:Uncharacterized protein n=1 Tax=Ignelater luminosus TaxID=2038154 RepID=A0A8K0CHF2_IGNLU|nr:hypothetical protein ILUMI_21586 [Ignelater luminosus]